MSIISKWLSWILLFKLAQVYETLSIADALKTGERNPIIQRTFDHYFSAFRQSSNSLKHYEDRNFILQRVLASFASLGAPEQSAKRYLKRLLLWSAVCNYLLRFRIFLSHKQNLCTSDRLENQYTWKWKKTKPDRKTYNELVNEQGLRSVLDVTGRKKYKSKNWKTMRGTIKTGKVNGKILKVSLNIKKCTNVSGRDLHQCKKVHCVDTMDFLTLMKVSARNVCTFFNVQWHFQDFSIHFSGRNISWH